MHAAQLNELRIEQEINLPVYTKSIQYETQHLLQMLVDFKEQMMNVVGLSNYNTKKYREEIQLIDSELKKIDSKNVSELKQLKLEYCQIEESTTALNRIIFVRNRSLTPLDMRKSASHLAIERKVMSAPINSNKGSNGTTYREGDTGSWTGD